MPLNRSVWARRESAGGLVSRALFNLLIVLVVCWGIGVNYFIVTHVSYEALTSNDPWLMMLGIIGSSSLGCFACMASNRPMVSFGGYNLVVVPFGLVMVKVLHGLPIDVLTQSLFRLSIVTIALMVLVVSSQRALRTVRRGIFWGLLTSTVGTLGHDALTGTTSSLFEWTFVCMMSALVAVNFARAQELPHTVDTAIDVACSLYMDIVYLFLELVERMHRRK